MDLDLLFHHFICMSFLVNQFLLLYPITQEKAGKSPALRFYQTEKTVYFFIFFAPWANTFAMSVFSQEN